MIGSIPYNDTSRVVRVLSEGQGMIPLWVRTGKKSPKAIWHPLSAVELANFRRKKQDGLGTFSEASRALPAIHILSDARRSAVAFFIAEVLDKSMSEGAPMPEVFKLVWKTVELLETEDSVSHLHIYFLAHLVQILGLMPEEFDDASTKKSGSLNLDTGEWSGVEMSLSKESHYLKYNLVITMMAIPGMKFDVMRKLRLEKSDRKELLLGMVMFIQLHHAGLRQIKCYDVLETIFSD